MAVFIQSNVASVEACWEVYKTRRRYVQAIV